VPHVVRSLVGSAHRRLLVGCLFAGPALLVSADAFARLAASPCSFPSVLSRACWRRIFPGC